MSEIGISARDEAIGWHVNLLAGEAFDWDAFTLWLEADPANAAAYDLVEAGDLDAGEVFATLKMADAPPAPAAANDNSSRRQWWVGGGALAATLAGLLLWGPTMLGGADPYAISTAAGETREIRLASGDTLALNGRSRVTLDRNNPRYARLEDGEVLLRVTHDAAKPFEISVGNAVIRDVGTVFNVVRSGQSVRVAVAEGSVIYQLGAVSVTIAAGETLTDLGNGSPLVRSTIEPAAVSGWRTGQLSYRNAPLAQIVDDLERATGERLSLAPALSGRAFSGTIRIDPDNERMIADLAALLNVHAERRGDGWLFVEAGRAAN